MSTATAKFRVSAEDQTQAAFKSVGSSLGRLQGQFSSLALPSFLTGAGITYGTKKILDQFAEYEDRLVDMGRVTDESVGSIRSRIESLGPELGSFASLTAGYYQIISAGVTDATQAMDLNTVAAKAGRVAHIEQSEVIKALTKYMKGYGGELKSAAEASDSLFAIERYGQATFAELVPIIGDMATISHQLNLETTELGASLAHLSQTAGSTAGASTQLEGILVALLKPTAELQAVFGQLGYASGQAMIAELGFGGALQTLLQHAERTGKGLGDLFGRKEALLGIMALSQNEFAGYNQMLANMGTEVGATDRAFARWEESFSGLAETTKSIVTNLAALVGIQLGATVKDWLEQLNNWVTANKDVIATKIEEWVGGFAKKVKELGTFVTEHGDLIKNIFVVGTIALVTVKIGSLAAEVVALAAAVAKLSATPMVGAAALLLGPLALAGGIYATGFKGKSMNEQANKPLTLEFLDRLNKSDTAYPETDFMAALKKTRGYQIMLSMDAALGAARSQSPDTGDPLADLPGTVPVYNPADFRRGLNSQIYGTSTFLRSRYVDSTGGFGQFTGSGLEYGEKSGFGFHSAGAFDMEQYNEEQKKLNEEARALELQTLQDRMYGWERYGNTISSVLAQSLQTQGNVLEAMGANMKAAIAGMAAEIASRAAIFGLLNIFTGGGFGLATGGLGGWLGFSPRAEGGPVSGGRSYLVGERGPEIFTPKTSGTIIPNGTTPAAESVTINFNGGPPEGMNKIQLAMWIREMHRDGKLEFLRR